MPNQKSELEKHKKTLRLLYDHLPDEEKMGQFLLNWGKENKAFQKNSGFRVKLSSAIVSYLVEGK